MNKTLVQEQFGKTAATYLTSTPHALGKSLERLVALTSLQKTCARSPLIRKSGMIKSHTRRFHP